MHPVKLIYSEFVTHDVKRFVVSRPADYHPVAGQATEVAISEPDWVNQKRPFTFTSLADDPNLEFIIKSYPDHHGVTEKLHTLNTGVELLLEDPFTTFPYKGPGTFVAGGAGVTPFIALLRKLKSKNQIAGHRLFFSNKTKADIILEDELHTILPANNLIMTLTQETLANYESGYINSDFLKKYISDFNQNFYICGPHEFNKAIIESLQQLGASPTSLVFD